MGILPGIAAAASIASAGVGIAGAVGGSQNSGGSSSSASQAPWQSQQIPIENAYNLAQNAYQNETAVPYPTNFVAGTNAMQTQANNAAYNYGLGAQNTYAPWAQVGSNLAATQGAYTGNAMNIASNGIGAQSPSTSVLANYATTGSLPGETSVNPALSSSLTTAGMQGLNSVGLGQSAAQDVADQALNTNGAMNAGLAGAAAYSNNPTLSGAIQAANYQTNLGLTEDTLPQIRAAAMQDGNANSSREGALEGLATQSASANMANTAATMESNAYNTGAQLGENGYLSSLNTALGAGNSLTSNGSVSGNLINSQQGLQQQAQQFGVTSQLGAANSAASQDLNYQTANTGAQLSANGQLGTGLGLGLTATNNAFTGTTTGLNDAVNAGTYQQQQTQDAINNQNDAYNFLTTQPSNLLNQYWNIVGNKEGQVTNSTSTPLNGGLSGALTGGIGGLTTGAGLYNNLTNALGGSSANWDNATQDGSGSSSNSSFGSWLNSLLGGSSGSTSSFDNATMT